MSTQVGHHRRPRPHKGATPVQAGAGDPALAAPPAGWRGLLYFGVPFALGMVLWSVVCLEPLQIELGSAGAQAPVVLLHLQPLFVLTLGLMLRSAAFTLVAFPCTVAAAFFVLTPLDVAPLATLSGGLTVASALTLFIVGTSAFGARTAPTGGVRGKPLALGVDPRYRAVARAWWVRLLLIVALWVVPAYALYGPGAREALVLPYGRGARDALALIHTAHLFVAVLASYVFIVLPAINQRVEVHELRGELAQLRARAQRRQGWRAIVVYLIAALVFALIMGFISWLTPGAIGGLFGAGSVHLLR